MVGKIVLVKIYFTDAQAFKVRPVLLIKEYRDEDYLYLPLTTNLTLGGVKVSHGDLEEGVLRRDSIIITQKLSVIHKSLILKELGTLKTSILAQVMKSLCHELNCRRYLTD